MDHIKSYINKIALENGFKNYELIFEKGSDLGFICTLNKCRIVEDGREFSLYCKLLPNDEEHNLKYNSYLLFEREVFIYKELFPIFEKFQKEHGINETDSDGFWSFPKCYYCNFDEKCPINSVIIMEDLTAENFEVKDKFVPSDFQHTTKLFLEFAKFHGLSLAISMKKPELLEKFKNLKNRMCFVMQTESMKDIAPRNLENVIKLFQNEDEKYVVEKLLPYKNNLWKQINERLDKAALQSCSVICHGDVWINNVLYNYHDDAKQAIKDIKLVDWQITYYGSLGSELTYYLYCCVSHEDRKAHQKELYEMYYNRVRRILSRYELDIDDILPLDTFNEQVKCFGLYTFGMANFATPLLCKYPERLYGNENATDLTVEEKKSVEYFREVMRDIILDMIDMEIL